MSGSPRRGSIARRRATALCAVLLALVGGAVVAAPAQAESCGSVATAICTPAESSLSRTSASGAASLADVIVLHSTGTVYPVKDGYLDSVRFAVRAVAASGAFVPVIGSAVLTRAGSTVRTWHLDGSYPAISWDGRAHGAITTGEYRLTVTAWSADGVKQTGHSMVRVSGKRLVREELVTSTRVDRHRVVKLMPNDLLDAFAYGPVKVRVVTVAVVHGPAKLVYTNDGTTATVPLRNGTHISPELPVPQGFNRVTVTHGWAPGVAKLQSLKTIWIHYHLQ